MALNALRWIGFLTLILYLFGCAAAATSPRVNREALSQIKIGTSTKDQVRQLLGEPVEVQASEFMGKTYEYWGYSKGAASKMILFGTSGKFEGPVIVFRPDGVVDSVGISKRLTEHYGR